jgi:hypothetical protein
MKTINPEFRLELNKKELCFILIHKFHDLRLFINRYIFFAHPEHTRFSKIKLFGSFFSITFPYILYSNLFSFNFIAENKFKQKLKKSRFYSDLIECKKLNTDLITGNTLVSGWIKPGFKVTVLDRAHRNIESNTYYGTPRPDVRLAKGFEFKNSGFVISISGNYQLDELHFMVVDQDGNEQGNPHFATNDLDLKFASKTHCIQCKNSLNFDESFVDGVASFFISNSTVAYQYMYLVNFLAIRIPFDFEAFNLTSKILEIEDIMFFQSLIGKLTYTPDSLLFLTFSNNIQHCKELRKVLYKVSKGNFVELTYTRRTGFEKSYELVNNFSLFDNIKWTESEKLWPNLTNTLDNSLQAGISNKLLPDFFGSNKTGLFLKPTESRVIEECILTQSFVIQNFFHFVIESLIPLCENMKCGLESIPVLLPDSLHRNQIQLLELLGYSNFIYYNSQELITIKKCHLVYGNNYVIDALELNVNSFSIERIQLLNLRKQLLKNIPDRILPNRVSPRLALLRKTGNRRFLRNDFLETQLVNLGFELIMPEDISITEMIDKIRNAESIFLVGGAAMVNLIFARPGTDIFYATSHQLENYLLPDFLANVFGLNLLKILGKPLSSAKSKIHNPYDYFHGDFTLNDEAIKVLQGHLHK